MKGELRLENWLEMRAISIDPQLEILRIDFAIRSRMRRNSSTTWSCFVQASSIKLFTPTNWGRMIQFDGPHGFQMVGGLLP